MRRPKKIFRKEHWYRGGVGSGGVQTNEIVDVGASGAAPSPLSNMRPEITEPNLFHNPDSPANNSSRGKARIPVEHVFYDARSSFHRAWNNPEILTKQSNVCQIRRAVAARTHAMIRDSVKGRAKQNRNLKKVREAAANSISPKSGEHDLVSG